MAKKAVKDTNFNMRMNSREKAELEVLFAQLGMTLPEAVNIFFKKSLLEGGLPFEVKMPRYNQETEAAMQEARDIMAGKIPAKRYDSVDEFLKDALAEDDTNA